MDAISFARIRVAVAAALGLPPEVMTDAQVATAFERICRAVIDAGLPGLNLLARDL